MLRSAAWRKWYVAPTLSPLQQTMGLIMRAGQQNSELLSITYGALVAQLVEDYEDPAAINEQLEKMCATARTSFAAWTSRASRSGDRSAWSHG